MVELVDAPDSKSGGSNILRVRVSLRPPKKNDLMLKREKFFIDLAKNKNNIQVVGSYNPYKVGCDKKEFYDDIHPKESCHLKIVKQTNFKNED